MKNLQDIEILIREGFTGTQYCFGLRVVAKEATVFSKEAISVLQKLYYFNRIFFKTNSNFLTGLRDKKLHERVNKLDINLTLESFITKEIYSKLKGSFHIVYCGIEKELFYNFKIRETDYNFKEAALFFITNTDDLKDFTTLETFNNKDLEKIISDSFNSALETKVESLKTDFIYSINEVIDGLRPALEYKLTVSDSSLLFKNQVDFFVDRIEFNNFSLNEKINEFFDFSTDNENFSKFTGKLSLVELNKISGTRNGYIIYPKESFFRNFISKVVKSVEENSYNDENSIFKLNITDESFESGNINIDTFFELREKYTKLCKVGYFTSALEKL